VETFHDGEVAVQARLGVREDALRVGGIIGAEIPPSLERFLAQQRIAVAASLDERARPWASLLSGPPGFIQIGGPNEIILAAPLSAEDPLASNIEGRSEMGLVVIDLATRRRARINGRGRRVPGGMALVADQVYGNCPKYIQKRRVVGEAASSAESASRFHRLDARAEDIVAGADTFFLASWHPRGGADASHRGGQPGFVRVQDDRTLEFPDYPGNHMFNSLGNLAGHPWAGLLFVDFETGDLVQATGRAQIVWTPATAVRVSLEEVVVRPGGSPLRLALVEPSPVNPPLPVTSSRAAASEGVRGERRTR
jgi:predicted pyridoxine 5'-phosphate oxidase superfamily flavin-nucleotide-binding protein